MALQEERAFVADQFAAYWEAHTERRPQPAMVPQGPPPPPVWPPPLAGPWQPPESQGPAPYRRAHFSPGPGAGRAPSAAVPPPGGVAAAGDPLPPRAAARAPSPPPFARFLPGGPPDPLLEAWNSAAPPPRLRPCPSGKVAQEVARGRGVSVRANPYTDFRVRGQGQGSAARTPGPSQRTREATQPKGWGQPPHGWPQHPQDPGQGAGRSQGQAPQDPIRTVIQYLRQWAPPRGPLGRPAGRPSASSAAGAPARGGPAGGGPAGGPPPAGLALPAAGDPGAHPGPEAPTPGSELDMLQQQQLGFEHRLYGAGDPNGDSWSEKVNVWSTHVIANDQQDRRLNWETAQEGSLWRASLQVLPRPVPLREPWGWPTRAASFAPGAMPRRTPAASCWRSSSGWVGSQISLCPNHPLDRRRLPLDMGWWHTQPPAVVLSRRDL